MMQWQEKPNGLVVHTPMWSAPKHVKSLITSRLGGCSSAPFNGLNLGTHVGDDPHSVRQNRNLITDLVPTQPIWLNQVHGTTIWKKNISMPSLQADGSITADRNDVLCILSADCLPILFTDQAGDIVAACHAGWRGLVRGVIDQTLQEMINLKKPDDPFIYLSQLMAYIGPGIGPEFFEVGPEVRQAFLNCSADPQIAACFMATGIEDKYLANLFALARINLQSLGLHQIYCADHCTYSDSTHLYSYRRNKITGRFGSFIYLE